MFSETQSPLPRRHAANDEARAGNKYASKSLGDFLCIHSLTSTRQVSRERETKRRRSLREGPLVSRGGAPSHPSNDGLIIHGDEHRTNRSARGGRGWGVAITQTDATRCHVSASVAGPITAHLAAVPPEAQTVRRRALRVRAGVLPGSSLASSAVLPSSMSKSTSRTVLRS